LLYHTLLGLPKNTGIAAVKWLLSSSLLCIWWWI